MKTLEPDRSLRLFFGPRGFRGSIEPGSVAILVSKDKWNDFGKRTWVDIRARLWGTDNLIETTGRIGFLLDSDSTGVKKIEELTGDTEGLVAVPPDARFFTMLPEMKEYRDLVSQLGAKQAQALLLVINDVVALTEFHKEPSWFPQALRSEVFALSFLRNRSSYFAFKNAGSVLRGLQFESIGQVSKSLQIDLPQAGGELPASLQFEFEHAGDLPKRIAVLIGKNGVGKSRSLGTIARAAAFSERDLSDLNGEPALIGRLLAFAPTNEAESVFPTPRPSKQRIWYRRFSLNRSRRSKHGEYLSDLIVQVARSDDSILNKSRWDLFTNAIEAIRDAKQIVLQSIDGEIRPLRNLTQGGGEQWLLEILNGIDNSREPVRAVGTATFPLSSGELSFLKFAAQICLHIENGTLVLLDEPETHLHPNFISRFMLLLDTVLEATASSAIVATHSAYLVKEVFKEQVSVLRHSETGQIEVEKPRLQTFGADVGAISYFVFGEDEPTRLASQLQLKLLKKHSNWDGLYDKYKDEFSLEFLNELRTAWESQSL